MTIGIFLLIGESFRTGEQGTRIRGDPSSYNEQTNACKSHLEFMSNFSNVEWNVIVITYTTQYDETIRNLYNPSYSLFIEEPIGYDNLFTIGKEICNKINYDFIFASRIDIFFKHEITSIFNPSWKTIRYPFICWKKGCTTNTYFPRVCDAMVFIPKKYNLKLITLDHESWYDLCENGFFYSDIDVMIHTYHDSDSFKDHNPLYYIVNRNETNEWYSKNDIFCKKEQFKENHKLFQEVSPTQCIILPC
jgi:hypothetical protein